MSAVDEANHKKRKLPEVSEIEIDVSAPEPPSKKALRKAKKKSAEAPPETTTSEQKTEVAADHEENSKKRSDYGIWIGNLAFSVGKDDLRKFFTSNCSFTETTITRIHLPKPSEKNGRAQNKGFAYVDFSNQKATTEALGLSEQLLSGRRVLIKDAKNFVGRPEKSQQENQKAGAAGSASGNPPSKRIFVGNLSFDATKEIIEEHFGKCGTVAHVQVATFQDSGKCKGYAWVTFEDLTAAEAAVRGFVMVNEDDEDEELHGSDSENNKKPKKPKQRRVWVNQILGRRMRMEFAEDATTRYKKRFGKDGEGKKNQTTDISETGPFEDQDATGRPPQRSRSARTTQEKTDYSRYDKETVQKLSGAIVESQGKKTTFD
ncbi:RNA binding protein Rnp24 [Aspergillus nomiae NRRL 13137]|uniref:RNA binding protein Rnp24 n=1 Tax=Aspergillus nomiae NRRL (strain ATCC 15546 / NRRL 13137 / CBS 260.88 / M93) TaxID=1509407 RepID=A0A0L1ISZ9_ASPN3|nr:RNA binding protein Rnp24 [Aspergillus nomiae NRRL 13137]KNG82609.1 RNA binding protein Rnp24 [Aspergillus nomiae NRRL 13137]